MWLGKPTEELYNGYQIVGTWEHGNVRLRLIVRLSVRLRVRLCRVHKARNASHSIIFFQHRGLKVCPLF